MAIIMFKLRQQLRPATFVHMSSPNNAASCYKNSSTVSTL